MHLTRTQLSSPTVECMTYKENSRDKKQCSLQLLQVLFSTFLRCFSEKKGVIRAWGFYMDEFLSCAICCTALGHFQLLPTTFMSVWAGEKLPQGGQLVILFLWRWAQPWQLQLGVSLMTCRLMNISDFRGYLFLLGLFKAPVNHKKWH